MKRMMCVLMCVVAVGVANASLVVVNGDWQANGGAKVELADTAGWSAIDGWTADGHGASGKSGTDDAGRTVGDGYGYSNGTGGLIFQTLSETIAEGETYTLTFDAFNTWAGGSIVGEIYYVDDLGARVVLNSTSVEVGKAGNFGYNKFVSVPGEVSFSALAGEAYLGKLLGVQFSHDASLQSPRNPWQCWAGFDNVTVVPEPATMVLLTLGGFAALRKKR